MANVRKQKKNSGLGRSIIKDRFSNTKKKSDDSFLHTSELKDGYDWGRLNLQSVTEQSNLEDFLSTAEMAGTEFTAEKMNIHFVTQESRAGLLGEEELSRVQNLHKEHAKLLRIPRRPPWHKDMSPSELDQREREAFLDWRRTLASLQEVDGIVMTPYEKNLDFWRQLWRVIERSDIIVQIVDARNPLLFYCPDLLTYVHEVSNAKVNLILINKADFLDERQRAVWADYFNKLGVRIAFWSAHLETERQEQAATDENETGQTKTQKSKPGGLAEDSRTGTGEKKDITENSNKMETEADDSVCHTRTASEDMDSHSASNCDTGKEISKTDHDTGSACKMDADESSVSELSKSDTCSGQSDITDERSPVNNTSHLYTGPELLELFRSLDPNMSTLTTVGMVGYPNVGKSSTVNSILKMKKVPVSATPGRTKHFQTLYVDKNLMLCDCPGLVFPSFVNTKAHLVVSGILPIDQMRDCIGPVSLVCQHIPRSVLCKMYGILLPKPAEGEDPKRPPTAYELLNAYGAMRGFMSASGVPDGPRASRYILKDYVNGKLLYCHPPEGVDSLEFNNRSAEDEETAISPEAMAETGKQVPTSKIDREFFKKTESRLHTKPRGPVLAGGNVEGSQSSVSGKPWKQHNNRNKREKLRRVFKHLDEEI